MSRITLKIPAGYRYFFYASIGLCWFSGFGFWLIRRFGELEGEFGPEPHFFQYPLLQTHGLAAFIMLLCLGAIGSAHIPLGWRAGLARRMGLSLSVHVLVSVLSAYALYYLASEELHDWLGNGHALMGFLLPLMLILHVAKARRQRKANSLRYC